MRPETAASAMIALALTTATARAAAQTPSGNSTAATPALPPDLRAARTMLQIPTGTPRIELRLPAMPPSRTWCRIENDSGTDGATVTWDPVVPGTLVRTFTVLGRGSYSLGCWSEPIRPTVKPELNFGYVWLAAAPSHACSGSYGAAMVAKIDEPDRRGSEPRPAMPSLEARCVPRPDLAPTGPGSAGFALEARGSMDGPSLRSFGALNEAMVQEVFAVLAETIVEQAEERGTQVLEKRLGELVCDPALMLPITCETVRTVRLADLAASGKQLQEALAADFAARAMPHLLQLGKIVDEKSVAPVLEGGVRAALELSRGRTERARDAARPLLLQLLENPWDKDEAIAYAVVRDCLASRACDPVAIRERLRYPNEYYTWPAGAAISGSGWSGANTFVTASLRVLDPPATATEAEQLRAVLHLALDIVEHRTPTGSSTTLQQVAAARRLVDGLLERDAGVIAAASIQLFSTTSTDPRLARLGRLATALTSFTSTSTSGREPSEEERVARREARREALKSLIEEYGSRKHRLGDTVLSLGGGAYVSGGAAFGLETGNAAAQVVPLSIPLGVAVDAHGESGWGFHGLLAPIDLGGYVTVRSDDLGAAESTTETDDASADVEGGGGVVPPAPADAVRPALYVGVSKLIPDADLVLVGAATIGMAPKLGLDDDDEGADESAFYVGLVAGAYIPLFDFN